jgi:hypothetical protein
MKKPANNILKEIRKYGSEKTRIKYKTQVDLVRDSIIKLERYLVKKFQL